MRVPRQPRALTLLTYDRRADETSRHHKLSINHTVDTTRGRKRKRERSVAEDLYGQRKDSAERSKARKSIGRGYIEHGGQATLPPSPVESIDGMKVTKENGVTEGGDNKCDRRVKSRHDSADAIPSCRPLTYDNLILEDPVLDNDNSDRTSTTKSQSDFAEFTAIRDDNTAGTTPASSPSNDSCTWQDGESPERTQAPLPDTALQEAPGQEGS